MSSREPRSLPEPVAGRHRSWRIAGQRAVRSGADSQTRAAAKVILLSGRSVDPRRRRYIGQHDARLHVELVESLCDGAIPLHATDDGLDEDRRRAAPHDQLTVGTRPRVDGDHLLILFAICAVIETNRNPAIVQLCPAPDESMVGDVERETFWRMGWRACAIMLCQIAHSPAQRDSSAVAIPRVVRNGAIPALLDLADGRCRAEEGMNPPCCSDVPRSAPERMPWEGSPPTAQSGRGENTLLVITEL